MQVGTRCYVFNAEKKVETTKDRGNTYYKKLKSQGWYSIFKINGKEDDLAKLIDKYDKMKFYLAMKDHWSGGDFDLDREYDKILDNLNDLKDLDKGF